MIQSNFDRKNLFFYFLIVFQLRDGSSALQEVPNKVLFITPHDICDKKQYFTNTDMPI